MTPYFKRFLKNQKPSELIKIREFVDKVIHQKMLPTDLLEMKPSQHQMVLKELAAFWEIPSEAALTKRRHSSEMNYKHAIRYAIRTVTGMPYQEVGKMLNCDHATIMWSIKFVNNAQIGDSNYYAKCIELAEHLRRVLTELDLNENQPTLHEIPCDIYFHN